MFTPSMPHLAATLAIGATLFVYQLGRYFCWRLRVRGWSQSLEKLRGLRLGAVPATAWPRAGRFPWLDWVRARFTGGRQGQVSRDDALEAVAETSRVPLRRGEETLQGPGRDPGGEGHSADARAGRLAEHPGDAGQQVPAGPRISKAGTERFKFGGDPGQDVLEHGAVHGGVFSGVSLCRSARAPRTGAADFVIRMRITDGFW